MYRNAIYSGEGIDMMAIDKVMEYESVDPNMRGVTSQKIIQWFTVMNIKEYERSNHAPK